MFKFWRKKKTDQAAAPASHPTPTSSFKQSLLSLEQRLMFDAAAAATAAEVSSEQVAQDQAEAAVSSEPSADGSTAEQADSQELLHAIIAYDPGESTTEVVFVDPTVPNYQELLSGMDPNIEVIMLDGGQDGMEQIASALAGRSGIDAIHLISHGAAGTLQLGSGTLNVDSMSEQYSDELATIQQALSEQADILVYGCDFAEGEAGQIAVNLLAELTGADVQASTDATGHISLGGDWEFEVQTGTIETQIVIGEVIQADWVGLLATETVKDTFSADSYSNNNGTQSWSTSWSETDASGGGASGGDVRVNSSQLRIDTDTVGNAISRGVNLSGATSATLTFDYTNALVGADRIEVRVSTDGGANYSTLGSGIFSSAANIGSGAASLDLSGYMSANTRIQFIVTATGGGERLYVDNVQISYQTNAAPTITSLSGDSLSYSEGDGAVVIEQGANALVADVDSANLDTGTLTVSIPSGGDSAEDVLSIRNQGTGAGQIGVSGSNVTYEGVTIGTFTGGSSGTSLVVTLNASATPTAVTALVKNITYENTDTSAPTTGARTVRYTLTDGDGGTSANYDTTMTVSGVNDAPTFGVGDGQATTSFGAGWEFGKETVVQPDGKILVGGYSDSGGSDDFSVARYNVDGTLDTSFGGGDGVAFAGIAGRAEAMVLQADGKVVLSGYTTTGGYQVCLARFNADGTLDMSFGGGDGVASSGVYGSAKDVVVQTDGKFLVAADLSNSNFNLMRFNSDGSLDTSFGGGSGYVSTDLAGSNDRADSLTIQADGKVVLAGFGFNGTSFDFALVRYNTDGSLDTSFNGTGKVLTDFGANSSDMGNEVRMQADGKIVVAGWSDTGGTNDFAIARYNTNGTLDTGFGTSGKVTINVGSSDLAEGLTIQSDGKILVTGTAGINGNDVGLVRLNTDGTLDTTFGGGDGIVTSNYSGSSDDRGYSVGVQSDGQIVVSGTTQVGGLGEYNVALNRYSSTGSLDTAFDPVSTLDGSPIYTEGGSPVVLDADVQIFDTELSTLNNFNGATLTLARNGGGNPDDALAFDGTTVTTSGPNLFVSGVQVGTFTFTGGELIVTFDSNATQARVNTLMQNIVYWNWSEAPPASVQIDWTFNDGNSGSQGTGGALQATGSTTVTIIPANDAPTITSLSGDSVSYTEGDGAVVIEQGANALVADVDSTNLDTGTLTVSIPSGGDSAEDVLSIRNQGTGAGQIGVSGSNITCGGVTIGTFTGGSNGSDLVITLNSSATPTAVTALVKNITYENTDTAAPTTGARTVRYVLTDGDGGTSSNYDTTVTVTAVNDAPTDLALSANTVAENATNGTVVGTVSGTDPDTGDTKAYSFTDSAGGRFAINSSTGQITVADGSLLNYESATNHSVTVRVTDSGGLTYEETFTINLTDVNEAPTGADATVTINEDTSHTLTAVNFEFSDVDAGDSLSAVRIDTLPGAGTLTLSGGSVTAGQVITVADITAGNLVFTPDSDTNGTGYASFTFSVWDSINAYDAAPNILTFNVTAVNDAPVITPIAPDVTFVEGGLAQVVDATGTIVDIDSANFDSGVMTVSISANGTVDDRLVVGNWGTGPGQVGVSGSNVTYEGIVIGTVGGGTSGSDPLVITFNTSATPTAVQEVYRSIQFNNVSDNPSTATRTLTIGLTDGDGGTATPQNKLVYVQGTNDAPVLTFGEGDKNFTEGALAVMIDALPTISDLDSTNFDTGTLTITISANPSADDRVELLNTGMGAGQLGVSGTNVYYGGTLIGTQGGGIGAAPFVVTFNANADATIVGEVMANIRFWVAGDAPSTATRTVEAVLTDGDGGTSLTASKQITVTAVNDSTVVTGGTSGSGSEDTTVTGTLTATDGDGLSDGTVFSVTGAATNGTASIDPATGLWSYTPTADWNGADSFTVTITDDAGNTATQVISVTVTPANDAPTDLALSANTVAENAANGTVVGTITGTDVDTGDTKTYGLTDTAGGRFAIDSTTGQLTVANASLLNYEAATSHTVTVRVTDSGGLTYDETFTINLTNINETPTAVTLSSSTVAENSANGTVVGMASTTDVDAGDSHTYQLMSNAGGRFAIDATTGVVTVVDGSLLNYEVATSHTVTIRTMDAGGLTHDQVLSIAVTDVNEATTTPTTVPGPLLPGTPAPPAPPSPPTTGGPVTSAPTEGGAPTPGPAPMPTVLPSDAARVVTPAVAPRVLSGLVSPVGPSHVQDSDKPIVLEEERGLVAWTVVEPVLNLLHEAADQLRTLAQSPEIPVKLSEFIVKELDAMTESLEEAMQGQQDEETLVAATAAGVSIVLSTGYVVWALRGGWLLASLLATMPAWRSFDPLPVLVRAKEDREHDGGRDDRRAARREDERIENLFGSNEGKAA